MSVSLIDGHIDDDVMTDEQIIKALECCIEGYCPDCFYGNTDQRHCKDDLMQNAIDLINRQKAENENLKDILYDADGVNLVNYWHQQCKIAENGCRNFEEENENLKAEIEKFKISHSQFISDINAYKEKLKTAKTEAIKEFAERLKGTALETHFSYASLIYELREEDIDDLVKEMVGEASG